MKLGTLEIVPAQSHLDLLATPVAAFLSLLPQNTEVGVAEIDPALSDTAVFCEHYQIETNKIANCVIVEAKRAERTWFAACVILGSTRADINGLTRRTNKALYLCPLPMCVIKIWRSE